MIIYPCRFDNHTYDQRTPRDCYRITILTLKGLWLRIAFISFLVVMLTVRPSLVVSQIKDQALMGSYFRVDGDKNDIPFVLWMDNLVGQI